MPRKKREPIELIEENLEDLAAESAEENLDEELEVLEADAEDDNEEVTAVEAITDEDEDTVVTEKPKRKRAPRKKKVEVEAASEESQEEVPPVEAPEREAEAAPAPITPAFDPKEDPMIRQWEMIRQISESICLSLEKASTQIKEMPAQTAAAFQENFRAPVARPAPITKIAVAAAVLALVVSVLSLSFAQSARQSVLAKETISQPVAPVAYEKPEPKAEALPPIKLTKPEPAVARVNPTAPPPKKVVAPLVAKKHAAAKKVH